VFTRRTPPFSDRGSKGAKRSLRAHNLFLRGELRQWAMEYVSRCHQRRKTKTNNAGLAHEQTPQRKRVIGTPIPKLLALETQLQRKSRASERWARNRIEKRSWIELLGTKAKAKGDRRHGPEGPLLEFNAIDSRKSGGFQEAALARG
jgi:hypothetical protein